MFYQVLIETNEKVGKSQNNRRLYEFDKVNLEEIENEIATPFLNNEKFQFDGYFLEPKNIIRLAIKETEKPIQEYVDYENANMSPRLIMVISRVDIVRGDKYTKDITKTVLAKVKNEINQQMKKTEKVNTTKKLDKTRVFVVHGQDDLAKTEVARFIEKLNFEAVILHEQVSAGKTIIEKIEEYSNVGFGVILYTPCDIGSRQGEEPLQPRARQNVVFEHGYLIGKLGRNNVCALVKGKIETPNDISGVVYIDMDKSKAWELTLAKELKNAGYDLDMNILCA